MSWASWPDLFASFFYMGGYALYVWGSYAVTAGLIVVEVVLLLLRKRDALDRLGGQGRP